MEVKKIHRMGNFCTRNCIDVTSLDRRHAVNVMTSSHLNNFDFEQTWTHGTCTTSSLDTLVTLICGKIALECHFYGHRLDNFYNLLTVCLGEQLLNIWNPCAGLLHRSAYYRDPSYYTDRCVASPLKFVFRTSTIIGAAISTFHEPIDKVVIHQKE